jgi:processive 1,2-diacylglycerol beta-glucosyltransferase
MRRNFWGGVYSLLDNSKFVENRLGGLTRLKNALADILHETQPDCVVSTYPVYAHVIRNLPRLRGTPVPFHHHRDRFHHGELDVVSARRAICFAWPTNDGRSFARKRQGIPASKIKALGFPVSHLFTEEPVLPLRAAGFGRGTAKNSLHHQHGQKEGGQGH